MKTVNAILEGLHGQTSSYGKLYESKIQKKGKKVEFEDCSNVVLWKKNEKSACVLFNYNGKSYMQGQENGHPVNLAFENRKGVEKILKDNKYTPKEVTKEDINNGKELIDKAKSEEKTESKNSKVQEAETMADVGIAAGGVATTLGVLGSAFGLTGMVTHASIEAIGPVASALLMKGGVLKVALASAISASTFSTMALAGAGVAVAGFGLTVASAVKKRIDNDKEKHDNREGYKCSWGRYYKKKGAEWERISKEQYHKEYLDKKNKVSESSNSEYEIVKSVENGYPHYEIYKDGKFISSEDTKREAEKEVERLEKKIREGVSSMKVIEAIENQKVVSESFFITT